MRSASRAVVRLSAIPWRTLKRASLYFACSLFFLRTPFIGCAGNIHGISGIGCHNIARLDGIKRKKAVAYGNSMAVIESRAGERWRARSGCSRRSLDAVPETTLLRRVPRRDDDRARGARSGCEGGASHPRRDESEF